MLYTHKGVVKIGVMRGLAVSIWSDRARWNKTVWLTVEDVAAITGLTSRTIYQYSSNGYNGFPAPRRTDGGRSSWAAGTLLAWTLQCRPQRFHRNIPRLYPRTPEPVPATFAGAQGYSLPGVGRFAVHTWHPGDAGAAIAIAYPDRLVRFYDPAAAVEQLFRQLPRRTAALALPNGEAVSTSSTFDPDNQTAPLLVVVERDSVYRPDPVGGRATRYNWFDLVNLLRTDVPWWSPLLNEFDAMLDWLPGSEPVPITPYTPDLDTDNLLALIDQDCPADVQDAIHLLVKRILLRLNRNELHDANRVTPGLVHGAVSDVDVNAPIPELSPEQTVLLLHHRADRFRAQQGIRMINRADHWAFMPTLTHSVRLQRNPGQESMAQDWVAGLTDVPHEQRSELGFWYVLEYVGSRATPTRWMRHRNDPNTWVIEDKAGIIYAGVGTHIPYAAGYATRASIELEAAFFEDSAGSIWPIPATGFDYYRTGYEGAGPQRLTETLTWLAKKANSDVRSPPADFDPEAELCQLICSHDAPLEITTEMLARYR